MSKDNNNLTILSGQSVLLPSQNEIQRRIYSIRGVQVMLDRDLAQLYQVETKVLNQAVKRNMKRFPDYYMFRLTEEEWNNWKSQFVTSNYMSEDEIQAIKMGVRRPPFAFTEQGVSQLSSVLKSDRAIETSIRIIDVFVAMRKFIFSNAGLFQRIESLEAFRIETKRGLKNIDARFDQIMSRLDDGSLKQKLGIFFDGQMFDAFVLVEELIQKATRRIVLIDDYITASLLDRFHKRNTGVTLDCYVKSRFATPALCDAIANYNTQYPLEPTRLHTFERSHDRWLIIDDIVYHFGASLKDLGKRWFSVDIVTEHKADDFISRL